MTRYHINHEGKIYPCRAKVLRCPYAESLHSEDKVELYYRLMTTNKDEVSPSDDAVRELMRINRLKSLYPLSEDIEKSDSPVELIIYTLNGALTRMANHDVDGERNKWKNYEDQESNEVYELLSRHGRVPANVPHRIAVMARKKLDERGWQSQNNTNKRYANALRKKIQDNDYSEYEKYWKEGLNKENYYGTFQWMTRDFENFTRDLNASRMITQPIFYGDIEKAKETIKSMDGYELLAAYDDYSVTDKEIKKTIKETNNFKFTPRKDLSDGANKKLKEWYDRNRDIYKSWRINTSKRILLSMEIAEELDRRQIIRQDGSVGKMLEESEE